MDMEHLATLERLRQNQREDYLKGSVSGSVQATDRLMKELRDIYRSDSFKKGIVQSVLQYCKVEFNCLVNVVKYNVYLYLIIQLQPTVPFSE